MPATKCNAPIVEVKPAAAPTNAAPKPPPRKLTADERRLRELREIERRYGNDIPENLRTHVYYLKHPPKVVISADSSRDFLRYSCERQIASLLDVTPGTGFLECPKYGEAFNREFMTAMLDKIEIADGDDETTQRVKRDVQAAKEEMMEICRSEGRKPNEVMNEVARNLYDLSAYDANIRAQVREAEAKGDLSDADVEDLYTAANEMLKAKGLKPFVMPNLARRALRNARRKNRQKEGTKQ